MITQTRKQVYSSSQVLFLCTNVGRQAAGQLSTDVRLAASTDVTKPFYSAGRLLAKYDANAPTPDLVGYYVNYDPASSNPDQAVCVAAIADGFLNVAGYDASTQPIPPLVSVVTLLIPTTYYRSTLVSANTPAVVIGFYASFTVGVVGQVYYADTLTNVETIQGTI